MIQERSTTDKNNTKEWLLASMVENRSEGISLKGKPEVIDCRYGKAIYFNGECDAIFLEEMPITGLQKFTIEILFNPSRGGSFEQRFLHCGESQGDRLLLELRATPEGWYSDAFISVGEQKMALIDAGLIHPYDSWYHLAFVINSGKLETYVNSKKELEGSIIFSPLLKGKTSIGVRQNEISWFKGSLYSVRFTDKVLGPGEFLSL